MSILRRESLPSDGVWFGEGSSLAGAPIPIRAARLRWAAGAVDLFCCRVDELPLGTLHEAGALGTLSSEEVEGCRRFKNEQLQALHLTSRLLVRCSLSRMVPTIAPAEWTFVRTRFGRPEVSPQFARRVRAALGGASLRFNLSHSGQLALCAVTLSGEVGVDVEEVNGRCDVSEIVDQVLAADELCAWSKLPEQQRRSAFFRLWVLKEAYVKACGQGLTLDPRRISFSTHGPGGPRVTIDGTVTSLWRFRTDLLFGRYLAATAFAAASGLEDDRDLSGQNGSLKVAEPLELLTRMRNRRSGDDASAFAT